MARARENEARTEAALSKRKFDNVTTGGGVKGKQVSHGAWSSMGGGGGGGITIKDARRSVESRGDVDLPVYFRTERGHRQHRRREQEQEAARLASLPSFQACISMCYYLLYILV